jgi:hypothetical protein
LFCTGTYGCGAASRRDLELEKILLDFCFWRSGSENPQKIRIYASARRA